MSNVKNYAERGGEKWIVNGILEVTANGQILINGVALDRAVNQQDSTATTIDELKNDFNTLLAKLIATE
jgi:hypothetical protein